MHLDTSFLILALAGSSSEGARLRHWLSRNEPLGISAVAWSEFCCGPLPPGAEDLARAVVGSIVPVGAAAAERASVLFNATGRRRGSMMDCLIAACAIEADVAVATSNVADFARFVPLGLRLPG